MIVRVRQHLCVWGGRFAVRFLAYFEGKDCDRLVWLKIFTKIPKTLRPKDNFSARRLSSGRLERYPSRLLLFCRLCMARVFFIWLVGSIFDVSNLLRLANCKWLCYYLAYKGKSKLV